MQIESTTRSRSIQSKIHRFVFTFYFRVISPRQLASQPASLKQALSAHRRSNSHRTTNKQEKKITPKNQSIKSIKIYGTTTNAHSTPRNTGNENKIMLICMAHWHTQPTQNSTREGRQKKKCEQPPPPTTPSKQR